MLLDELTFPEDGAQLFRAAIGGEELDAIETALSRLPRDQAGIRLQGTEGLVDILAPTGRMGRHAASVLGRACRPVRAILFDKTPATNWALGWHQDRTIVVKQRLAVDGFDTWSVKAGMLHVEPPFELLAGMVTLRLHLDAAPASNAPLLIAPRSHKLGRIAASEVQGVVRRCGTAVCLANEGDVWLYSTPILHASEAAADPLRRRVLQVDFAHQELPGGLEWQGL
jgi:hypothetical protein